MSAIPCATPSASASPDDRSSARRVPRPRRSATSIATPTTASVTTITFGVRSVSSRPDSKQAHRDERDRADDDEPRELRGFIGGAAEDARQGREHLQQVGAEVDQDGGQRADVARHVERTAELLGVPAEEEPCEQEVGGTRHGQELGEPLHHTEQRRLEQQHAAGPGALRDPHVAAAAATARPLDRFLDRHGRASGRGLAAAQDDRDRRGDEDGRVRAADDADEHREREAREALRRRTDTAPATDRNVTPDVMIVRPSVWLTLRFTTLSSDSRRSRRAFSRTRSKMTIVSFTE